MDFVEATVDPKSTRAMAARLGTFDEFLGQLIPTEGGQNKAAVIERGAGTLGVSFNKYAGMIEWTNGIFLFINVPLPPLKENLKTTRPGGGPGPPYKNIFSSTDKSVSFFGKPSQHKDTPVIKRLLAKKDPVLLFCRYEGQQYRFFGRLQLSASDLQHSPVAFTFKMLDWDAITVEEPVREMMQLDAELPIPKA
ncbi:hypothetical protein HDU93_007470 [Gonapodya sp. JEL0774]|nr:hypothetical protein HDU93_007470 [Gonapodya sp. JEL0774]